MRIHEAAAVGFQQAAGEYERSRPGYPADAVARIVELGGIERGRRVLDLACGTGKMTRLLAETGADLVGADPVDGMLRQFKAVLPGVAAVGATAESLPFADAAFDAIVVAQGFHWFDHERALAEMHRAAKPGALLALIWNVRDESVGWVAAMNDIFKRYESDVMRFWKHDWKPPLDRTTSFTPIEREDFMHAETMTPDGVIDRVLSVSFIATLPQRERERVSEEMRAVLAADPAARGKDSLVFPYRTELHWCRRIP